MRKGELDHELIWSSVSLVSLGCLLAWLRLGLPFLSCPFHDLTGFPCLTCGATRCFIQLCHGHFSAALRWNPGVFASLAALAAYDLYAMTVLALRLPRLRLGPVSSKTSRALRVLALVLIASNWIYLLLTFRKS